VEAIGSPRYAALLQRLDAFVADPPFTPQANDSVGDLTRRRMRNDWRRLRARARAADETADPAVRRERLHEVRKAAKRARYAAEAMTVVHGQDAARFAKAVKRIQSTLGESRDSVVTQPVLRRLGVQAHLDGQNGFTYGRLHALEQTRVGQKESEYAGKWRKASRRKLRRWFA
jgi:CHAD domain-containing protein